MYLIFRKILIVKPRRQLFYYFIFFKLSIFFRVNLYLKRNNCFQNIFPGYLKFNFFSHISEDGFLIFNWPGPSVTLWPYNHNMIYVCVCVCIYVPKRERGFQPFLFCDCYRHYLVPFTQAKKSKWKRAGVKLHIYNDHTFVAKHLSKYGLNIIVYTSVRH